MNRRALVPCAAGVLLLVAALVARAIQVGPERRTEAKRDDQRGVAADERPNAPAPAGKKADASANAGQSLAETEDDDCCGEDEAAADPAQRPDLRHRTPAAPEREGGGNVAAGVEPESIGAGHDGEGGDDEPDIKEMAKLIATAFGKKGELKDEVYTVSYPRDDLDVTIEGMDVPAAAGLTSEFRFYRCPCGKAVLIGQFVVADYEANDVADSLLKGRLTVASVGPLLMYERPRLMLIRFQGEGKAERMARVVREALTWTGRERMSPQEDPAALGE